MKLFLLLASFVGLVGGQVVPDVTPMDYGHQGDALQGFLAMPESSGDLTPALIIIPDWDGVNFYEQQRATLAATEMGWIGFAADIYGPEYHEVANMTLRRELYTTYVSDTALFTGRIQAAVDAVKAIPGVDPDRIALAGYCFGGSGVLMYALLGLNESVAAIVSIHGGLAFNPPAGPTVGPKLLILSGGDDDASSSIMDLETAFDTANATWEITRYSGIEHAFSVFSDDRYNAFADTRSSESMYHFLQEIFDEIEFVSAEPAAIRVTAVPYEDTDGTMLQGYLAMPDDTWQRPLPAVVIFPDWDGVNDYEKKRATMLADMGYVAFAADIYGATLQEGLTTDVRIAQTTIYRSDMPLYTQRMQRAIDLVAMYSDDVSVDDIAIIGYCFGGTGVVQYGFSGATDAKLAVAFHGGLQTLPPVAEAIAPYMLILSGGADDSHGNQTQLEGALNGANADWEISRYSGVGHGFTAWESPAYNLNADVRSWESMTTAFHEKMMMPEKIVVEDKSTSAQAPTASPTAESSAVLLLRPMLFSFVVATVGFFLFV